MEFLLGALTVIVAEIVALFCAAVVTAIKRVKR